MLGRKTEEAAEMEILCYFCVLCSEVQRIEKWEYSGVDIMVDDVRGLISESTEFYEAPQSIIFLKYPNPRGGGE